TNSSNEYFTNRATSILDPTPTIYQQVAALQLQSNPSPYLTGPGVNGGSVVLHDTASGESNVYIIPVRAQFSAAGMYQGPWGINFAGTFFFRQGYAQPFFRNTNTGDVVQQSKSVLLISNIDDGRLPSVA